MMPSAGEVPAAVARIAASRWVAEPLVPVHIPAVVAVEFVATVVRTTLLHAAAKPFDDGAATLAANKEGNERGVNRLLQHGFLTIVHGARRQRVPACMSVSRRAPSGMLLLPALALRERASCARTTIGPYDPKNRANRQTTHDLTNERSLPKFASYRRCGNAGAFELISIALGLSPQASVMPAPLSIRSLSHLGITTRRLEESKAFYRDVLGFREVERPNFNFRGAWLFNQGLMLHLIDSDSAGERGGEILTRGDHVALQVEDLAAAQRLLDEHGIPYRQNEIADTGVRQLFFQDPDGHHIEIGAYPPTPRFI